MMFRLLRPVWIALFVVACCAGTAAGQGSVDLAPTKDNTLYEDANGRFSNGQGDHLFVGRTNQGELRRALLAFDVAGAVPAEASIDSVLLTLTMSRTAGGEHPLTLHRVLADWGEGASNAGGNEGSGADAATGDATWIFTFFDTMLWTMPGGAFAAAPSASRPVGGNGAYTWGSTSSMVADVQAWLNMPETNFGWMLRGDEATTRSAKRFDSRARSTSGPVLRIFFSTPTASEDAALPGVVRLAQNYPNPFERTTTIPYELAQSQPVTLAVYDALGRRVATLVDGWQGPGVHRAVFETGVLPAGVYLYRLTTQRSVHYRTMTVLH